MYYACGYVKNCVMCLCAQLCVLDTQHSLQGCNADSYTCNNYAVHVHRCAVPLIYSTLGSTIDKLCPYCLPVIRYR